MTKTVNPCIVSITLLFALSPVIGAEPAPKPKPKSEEPKVQAPASDIVVEVEGAKLTQSELDTRVMQAMQSRGMDRLPPEMTGQMKADLEPKMIAGFISKILLEKDAEENGMKASAKEVTEALAKIKSNFPTEEAFAQALKENSTSEAELRADIETEIKIKQVIDKCVAGVSEVTEGDVKAFYEEEKDTFKTDENVHARHILVAFAEGDSDKMKAEKKAVAEKIRQKVVDGSDFATVAKDHSDCPSSERGGDLGTFGRNRMDKVFEEAAFSQKIDEVGPIVTTKFGHHIIQVLERKDAGVMPLKDVSERISGYLKSQREQEAILAHIEKLKEGAKIKYRDPQPAKTTTN